MCLSTLLSVHLYVRKLVCLVVPWHPNAARQHQMLWQHLSDQTLLNTLYSASDSSWKMLAVYVNYVVHELFADVDSWSGTLCGCVALCSGVCGGGVGKRLLCSSWLLMSLSVATL